MDPPRPRKQGLIGFRATDAEHAALVRVAQERNATLTALLRRRLEPLLTEGRRLLQADATAEGSRLAVGGETRR